MGGGRTENSPQNYQSASRKAVVSRLLSLKKKSEGLSRSAQFLSVSIVDKFFSSNNTSKQKSDMSVEETRTYAAASLLLACKYDGLPTFIFQKIHDWFFDKQAKEVISQKIAEVEAIILEQIDFTIPFETPYTHLEKCLIEDKHSKSNLQMSATKSLKILMLALEDWPIISSNPQIANDILELVMNGKGTKQAKKIYSSIRSQQKRMSPKLKN